MSMSEDGRGAIEARIRRLAFTRAEYEYPFDAERSDDGWAMTEYQYRDDEDGYIVSDSDTIRRAQSLEAEVADWVAAHGVFVEVTVEGISSGEFLTWVLPLLAADQAYVQINGESFETFADESGG